MNDLNRTQKRRGRPPAPKGTARDRRVVTFVTDREFKKLNALAAESNNPLSLVVYHMLNSSLEKLDELQNQPDL